MTQNPLFILFGAMLVNNIILGRLLGLCHLFKTGKSVKTAASFGIFTMFIMIITAIVNSIIYSLVLVPFNLIFLRTFIFITVIIFIIYTVKAILQKLSRKLYDTFTLFIPALSINCAVLAVSLLSTDFGFSLVQSIAFSTGSGLGLMLVTTGFLVIQEKLELIPASPALKGYPILFIAASLMALAMSGFYGLLGMR